MDVVRNIEIKDKEKCEVPNAFFASVFNGKTSCSLGVSPLSCNTRIGSRIKPPSFKGKCSTPAAQMTHTQIHGGRPRVLRELVKCSLSPFHHLLAVLANREGPR